MLLAVAAVLVVVGGSLVSLLLYLPAEALARGVAPSRPDLRARLCLTALVTPVAVALVTGGWGLSRQLLHPLFSPHADRLRPHICLRSFLDTPDGPFRARLLAGVCVALVVAAGAVLVGGLIAGAWEGRRLERHGRRREAPDWAAGVDLWETEEGLASSRGWRRAVAVGKALPRLFPGAEGKAIVAHEMAHARRRDSLVGPVAAALVLLQGLSPAAWALHRRWRLEREAVCDRYAAEQTSPEAVREALATAEALTRALEETSPLSAQDRHALTHLAWRRQTLEKTEEGEGARWEAVVVVALGVGLALVTLLTPALRDSLQCVVEGLRGALGR